MCVACCLRLLAFCWFWRQKFQIKMRAETVRSRIEVKKSERQKASAKAKSRTFGQTLSESVRKCQKGVRNLSWSVSAFVNKRQHGNTATQRVLVGLESRTRDAYASSNLRERQFISNLLPAQVLQLFGPFQDFALSLLVALALYTACKKDYRLTCKTERPPASTKHRHKKQDSSLQFLPPDSNES
jgi:hypothetical protein